MRMLKSFILRCFAVFFIIGMSGCGSFFLRELPKDAGATSDGSGKKYEISSISVAADDVPVSFLFNLKRYLFAELSKRKLLGRKEDNPCQIHILVGYYRVVKDSDANRVASVTDFRDPKTDEILGESEISTLIRKARNIEDVAKLHAKEIVRFLAGEKKK